MFSQNDLQQGLLTHSFGKQLYIFDSLDSTNDYAKILASQGMAEGCVVITDHQNAGRGRMQRAWFDEQSSNLLLSLLIRPKIDAKQFNLLPFFAAISVALTIEQITGLSSSCKWPNDVLINGKKCCGILLESSIQNYSVEYAIIGIGLNINQIQFDNELETKATSLRRECGKEFDRCEIFRNLMQSLEELYKNVQQNNFARILYEWKMRDAVIGKQVTLFDHKKEVKGLASTITSDGGLVIVTSEGLQTFYSGDVTMNHQY